MLCVQRHAAQATIPAVVVHAGGVAGEVGARHVRRQEHVHRPRVRVPAHPEIPAFLLSQPLSGRIAAFAGCRVMPSH